MKRLLAVAAIVSVCGLTAVPADAGVQAGAGMFSQVGRGENFILGVFPREGPQHLFDPELGPWLIVVQTPTCFDAGGLGAQAVSAVPLGQMHVRAATACGFVDVFWKPYGRITSLYGLDGFDSGLALIRQARARGFIGSFKVSDDKAIVGVQAGTYQTG